MRGSNLPEFTQVLQRSFESSEEIDAKHRQPWQASVQGFWMDRLANGPEVLQPLTRRSIDSLDYLMVLTLAARERVCGGTVRNEVSPNAVSLVCFQLPAPKLQTKSQALMARGNWITFARIHNPIMQDRVPQMSILIVCISPPATNVRLNALKQLFQKNGLYGGSHPGCWAWEEPTVH